MTSSADGRAPSRVSALLLLAGLVAAPAIAAAPDGSDGLSAELSAWLDSVAPLMTDAERDYFLGLDEDFRRWVFVDEFWQSREGDRATARREFRRRWESRVDAVTAEFGSPGDVRSLLLLLNGEPGRWIHPSGRELTRCFMTSEEVEIWFYKGSERTTSSFIAIVFLPDFETDGFYRLWTPEVRFRPRTRRKLGTTNPAEFCEEGWLEGAMGFFRDDEIFMLHLMEEVLSVPEPPSEWLETFAARSTEVPKGAEVFAGSLGIEYPGRHQSRTVTQFAVSIDQAEVDQRPAEPDTGGMANHAFLLLGEVVRGQRLLETFRYRFEVPRPDNPRAPLPLIFSRALRPGPATLLLRIEDLHRRRFARFTIELDVPDGENLEQLRRAVDSPFFPSLAEASTAAARGERSIKLVPPPEGEIKVGRVRFGTRTVGDIDAVTFFLDERPILTKTRPPFSVELDMGSVAATHRLRVVAVENEVEVARDEILVNHGGQRFRARIVEPYRDGHYDRSVRVVVEVDTPDEVPVDRLEIFLNERLVTTLYQPPFVQPVLLDGSGLAYLRAVAYLADGNTAEDLVFINAPGYLEEVDVQYVELFANVVDGRGRPILGLERDAFRVFEDDEPQEIRRFEFVETLPIHAALLLDTSASMEPLLEQVAEAARGFAEQTIEPQDRLAVISFNSRPWLELKFSSDTARAADVLSTLRAEGSTALYDGLVFALTYFDGIKGQKALLLLSDGKDEGSTFDVGGAIETARRSGVTVYAIGLGQRQGNRAARQALRRIAEPTGGRAFFIDSPLELPAIYDSIARDLRARYLVAYQSTSDKDAAEFRRVRLEVEAKDSEARTISGYYP